VGCSAESRFSTAGLPDNSSVLRSSSIRVGVGRCTRPAASLEEVLREGHVLDSDSVRVDVREWAHLLCLPRLRVKRRADSVREARNAVDGRNTRR